MDTRRKHTRKHLDHDPSEVVDDPKNLLQKTENKASQSGISMDRVYSFPKDRVKEIQYLSFDINFEHSLFRSKSEFDLFQTLFYEKKCLSLINPSLQPSFSSSTILVVTSPNTTVGTPKASLSSQPST